MPTPQSSMFMLNIKLYFQCHSSAEYIRGSEFPIVVVFCTSLEGELNDKVISRCMSQLIMICIESEVKKFFDSDENCYSFAYKIDVFGKNFFYNITSEPFTKHICFLKILTQTFASQKGQHISEAPRICKRKLKLS